MPTVDKRKYLHPEMVAKLGNMSLRARLVVEGYIIGLHKSPYHGFSVEFAEHRAYGPGDEIRHIDWKLYGKTDRYYIKQYEEETNLRSYLIMDISKSMTYRSKNISKLEYAGYLTAALSYLMLHQKDGIGLILFDKKIQSFIPPRSTSSHLNTVFSQLDQIRPGEDTQVGNVLHEMAERIKKRGLVILISDLFDEIADAENLIKLIGNLPCKVNVIPYNEIGGTYERPSQNRIKRFVNILHNAPFTVTIRWSKGTEIDAGCGQLAVNTGGVQL